MDRFVVFRGIQSAGREQPSSLVQQVHSGMSLWIVPGKVAIPQNVEHGTGRIDPVVHVVPVIGEFAGQWGDVGFQVGKAEFRGFPIVQVFDDGFEVIYLAPPTGHSGR